MSEGEPSTMRNRILAAAEGLFLAIAVVLIIVIAGGLVGLFIAAVRLAAGL